MKQSAGRRRWNGDGTPTAIGTMVAREPEAAKVEILEALEKARGRVVGAAVDLAISRRHLTRMLWALDLWPQVDAIRERWARRQVDTPVTRLISGESPRCDSEAGHNQI